MELENFEAVVFDMDGVLIDSEPFWFESERDAMAVVGINLTEELYQHTMGLRVNEVVEHWKATFPWHETHPLIPNEQLENDIMDGVIARIRDRGQPMPGVDQAMAFFRDRKMKVGLASSSFYKIIDAVIDALELAPFDDIYSAEDEPFGKPDPGVYLRSARRLDANPFDCLAIEDSVNGIKSANAAGFTCIAVPDKLAWQHTPEKFAIAPYVVTSLSDINEQWAATVKD